MNRNSCTLTLLKKRELVRLWFLLLPFCEPDQEIFLFVQLYAGVVVVPKIYRNMLYVCVISAAEEKSTKITRKIASFPPVLLHLLVREDFFYPILSRVRTYSYRSKKGSTESIRARVLYSIYRLWQSSR